MIVFHLFIISTKPCNDYIKCYNVQKLNLINDFYNFVHRLKFLLKTHCEHFNLITR